MPVDLALRTTVLGTNVIGAEVVGIGCFKEPQASMAVRWLKTAKLELVDIGITGTLSERGLRLDGLINLAGIAGLPDLGARVGDRDNDVLERTGEA